MKSMTLQERARIARILTPSLLAGRLITARTRDNLTFDASGLAPIDQSGNQRGRALDHTYRTHDGRTVDSTGAFFVGELERLDQTLHMPLVDYTWGRDIDLREDVSIADEVSSFTLTNFASQGGLGAGAGIRNSKAWMGKSTDQVTGINIDMGKIANPLRPWAMELRYTILELESAIKAGRPIDAQKYEGLRLKWNMDVDEQVYVGDSSTGDTGLFNHTLVTNVSNVPNGAASSPLWSNKTPAEILADLNAMLISGWAASGYAVMPNRVILPPTQFGLISTQVISTAGSTSILKYLMENNILNASGRGSLQIQSSKWLVGAGSGGTIGTASTVDRMVAYTKRSDFVRYPMTMMVPTPIQYQSIYHLRTYYCRLGVVELVYPETMVYRDGL